MSIKINIEIPQGATFSQTFTVTSPDVSGNNYTANAAIQKHHLSVNSVSFTTLLVSNGALTISLTANQTAALDACKQVYDIYVTDDGGVKTRVYEGIALVTPTVT